MVSYSNRHRIILYLVLFIKFKQVHKVLQKYILKEVKRFFSGLLISTENINCVFSPLNWVTNFMRH